MFRTTLLASLAALLFATPTLADCNLSRAALSGGYRVAAGSGWMEVKNELYLERNGPGLYGAWTGTIHRQVMTFSAPVETVPAPNAAIPGVKAVCTTTTPDSSTVDVTCEGSYPFTLHKDWTITWAGRTEVIGNVVPPADGAPGQIEFDLTAGAPGYEMALAMGMSNEMRGPIETGFDTALSIEASEPEPPYTELPAAHYVRFKTVLDPPMPTAEVTLFATWAHDPGASAIVKTGPGPAPDSVDVTFHGTSGSARTAQAKAVVLTGSAKFGDCEETQSWTAYDVLREKGLTP